MMEFYEGSIEAISGRLMSGSLRAAAPLASNVVLAFPDRLPAAINIEFFDLDRALGATVAELLPGESRLAFEFMLPRAMFDGQVHEITARIAGAPAVLDNNRHLLGAASGAGHAPQGFLEQITEDGWVVGWAWYPEHPEARVEVELLVDGHAAGTAHAGLFRADVAEAGNGDGCYGFSWPLPFSVLAMARDVTISARDKLTGQALTDNLLFRQRSVADALSKIAELEHDVRLLNETIATLEARGAADERAAADLFRTVGAFFKDLSDTSAAGQPLAQLRSVKAAAADVTSGLAPLAFGAVAQPAFSVFVRAGADLKQSHATLSALRETLGEAPAEVFLLDDGACDETPLLAMVVQNMRYARLAGGAVARCNDAMRLGAAEVAVFLEAGMRPGADWAEALGVFAARPNLGALAARVADEAGVLVSAGVSLQNGEPVARGRWAEVRAAVDAVAPEMFAVRRQVWQELQGLDEGYATLSAALVEFCARARMAGRAVGYEPGFGGVMVAVLSGEADIAARAEDSRRLAGVVGAFREAAE